MINGKLIGKINAAEWIDEEFFNPFGPNLLRLKINEDIRLELLDSITLCLNNHEDMHFTGGTDRLNNAIKNSIVDGKIGRVSEDWINMGTPAGNIIKNTIESVLCRYGENYYNTPCISTIEDVWYVVMKAGDFHFLHNHPAGTELSGAIYLEVPDNLPEPQGAISWTTGDSTEHLHTPRWQWSPEPGDVFLWPSWLMHEVYPFRSEQERIIISFNGTAILK
jgi:hypothetical protein